MERRSSEPAPTVSLGVRVAVFTSLSVLAAVLLALLVVEVQGRSEARSASNEQLRRARVVAAERLSRDGEGLRRLAATVARDPKFFALLALRRSERTATFRQSLEGVIREFQADADVEIFDVTDEWGATAAASERPAAPEPSRGASPLVRRALAREGALGFRLEGGRLYRVAVVPVMAGGAAPVGTLTLGSPLDESFADAVRTATGADVLLLAGGTAAGNARPTPRPIITTLSDAGARSVLETIGAAPKPGTRGRLRRAVPVSLAKSPALAVDVPLDGPTEGGAARLLLISPVALETGLAPLRETLLAVGSTTAALALLVGFVVGRRMSRRLRRLGAAAREAGIGNYDVSLPAPAGDEVGLLTADFEAMREMQRREFDRMIEIDRMKTDFLSVTAEDLMVPVEEIRKAGEALAARNAPALGPEGLRRLKVIREGADTLGRIVQDLGGASVVLSRVPEAGPSAPAPEGEEEASLEIVTAEAAFHPTHPAAPAAAPAPAPALAPDASPDSTGLFPPVSTPLHAPLDVAALVESVAVELIVAAAERGIEVDMAIEPDLLHPSAAAEPLAASLRRYGQDALGTLPPGSIVSFGAWSSPEGILVRAEGGAAPLDIALPLADFSRGVPDLSQAR